MKPSKIESTNAKIRVRKNNFILYNLFFSLFILGMICLNGCSEKDSLGLSTDSLEFHCNGEKKTFMIESNIGWTVDCGESTWLTVSSSSGSNNGNITVTAEENTSKSPREAIVTVSGQGIIKTINVTQGGFVASITVSPTSLTFISSAEQKTFNITSNTKWTVKQSAGSGTWLSASPTSGTKDGTITVNTTANTSVDARTATITVTADEITQTVEVTKAGADAFLTVSDSSIKFDGGDYTHRHTLNITSNTSWEVKSSKSWLSVSRSSGSNNGAVTITADSYTVKKIEREAIITVSGGGITRTIKVIQMGIEDALSLGSSSTLYFKNDEVSGKNVAVFSNINWTVTSSASWLTVSPSSGSDDGVITAYVSGNLTESDRSATITVSGSGITRTIDVTQWRAIARGSIVFWTSSVFTYGSISVTLSGHGTKEIRGFYYSGTPSCGDQYTATFRDLPIGTYSYTASAGSYSWSGTVKRTNDCHSVKLLIDR